MSDHQQHQSNQSTSNQTPSQTADPHQPIDQHGMPIVEGYYYDPNTNQYHDMNGNPYQPLPHDPDYQDPHRQSYHYSQQDSSTPQSLEPTDAMMTGHMDKESAPFPGAHSETIKLVEVGFEQEIEPEVQEFMERVEKDKIDLDEPIVVHGDPVVHPANWNPEPSVTIPVSRDTVLNGLKNKVHDNVRWLATWCVRVIKKFNGNVIYTDPKLPENKN